MISMITPFRALMGLGVIVSIFTAFTVWLSAHDDSVRATALSEFNTKQIALTEKTRLENEAKLKELVEAQNKRLFELELERQETEKETQELRDSIKNSEGAEEPASELLKETIRKLQERANR